MSDSQAPGEEPSRRILGWLAGKTAFITGATSGIGRALTLLFCEHDVPVIAHGRSPDRMRSLCDRARGGVRDQVLAELGDRDSQRTVESAIQHHQPELLVLNAGLSAGRKRASEWTDTEVQRSLSVNLAAPIYLARTFASLPAASEQRRLVLVLSTSCYYPRRHMGLYVAAKCGLMGFGRVMQQEMHGLGLRTLLLYPGRTDTGFRANDHPEYMRPRSVAEAILALLSLPDDLVPYEFLFRPYADTRI